MLMKFYMKMNKVKSDNNSILLQVKLQKKLTIPFLRNRNNIFTESDNGEIPQELEFFSGGAEQASSLFSRLDEHNLI